jgi:hypothetical protein
MEKLYISPTPLTPEINFSPEENIFLIKGVSAPEDVVALYTPVNEWVKRFVDDLIHFGPRHYSTVYPITFKIELVYFNSSSAKFLYDMFMELKRLLAVGIPAIVEWTYDDEDEDIKEAGSAIASLLDMEFIFIPQNNEP